MTNVIDFSEKRQVAQQQAAAVRAQLLELTLEPVFPGRQYLDQITQEPTLDALAEERLTLLFNLFGVKELSALNPDFERVSATWYQLFLVGGHLREVDAAQGVVPLVYEKLWRPEYLCYVRALWAGVPFAIDEAAANLGISKGVTPQAPRLWRKMSTESGLGL